MRIIDKELREKFDDQCIKYQKPIIKWFAIFECIAIIFIIKDWIDAYINPETQNSDLYPWIRIQESVFFVSSGLGILIYFCKPKQASLIIIVLIAPVCVSLFYASIYGEKC